MMNADKLLESYKEESEDYARCLEEGLHILCVAMGVDSDFYDADKSDIENYLDCFKDAAQLIKGE